METSVTSNARGIPAFWAAVRAEALRQWNADSSRPSWNSVEPLLLRGPRSPLSEIARREQIACSALQRIHLKVAPQAETAAEADKR